LTLRADRSLLLQHFDLGLQRPSGGSLPRHPRKCRMRLYLCGSIPTQSLCSGRCLSAIQVEPSISLKCFKSLPLRKPPARGRGQTWRNTLRPVLVITLNSTAPLPKRKTAHSWHSFGYAVYLTHSSLLPFGSQSVCSVVVARHCASPFFRRSASPTLPSRSAVSSGAFAVQAFFSGWSASWWNALQIGVAVAEERSYPLRLRRHCTYHNCKHRHIRPTCICFRAIASSAGNSPVRGVKHSARVSLSVFSSRNFRTYRPF